MMLNCVALLRMRSNTRPCDLTTITAAPLSDGFARACADGCYTCLACCIGYDHAHLVLQRHDRDPQTIAGHLKSHATRELTRRRIHPQNGHIGKRGGLPTPWSEGCWKVFIDDAPHVASAIRYVQRHPEKEGMPTQKWAFVAGIRLGGGGDAV